MKFGEEKALKNRENEKKKNGNNLVRPCSLLVVIKLE